MEEPGKQHNHETHTSCREKYSYSAAILNLCYCQLVHFISDLKCFSLLTTLTLSIPFTWLMYKENHNLQPAST